MIGGVDDWDAGMFWLLGFEMAVEGLMMAAVA